MSRDEKHRRLKAGLFEIIHDCDRVAWSTWSADDKVAYIDTYGRWLVG